MTAVISDLLPKLQQYLEALPDVRDAKSLNEQADSASRYNETQGCISRLTNLPNDVAHVQTKLDAVKTERASVLEKEQELSDEIANFKDWRWAGNLRERDIEYERQRDLKRVAAIHQGTLLKGPGRDVPDGRLPGSAHRGADRAARRYQRALDDALLTAERLLGATVGVSDGGQS